MDSIKRWENSDLFKMPTMPDLPDLLPVLVTNQAGSSNKFVKNNQIICQDLARIESCRELTQPCCLKPFELQFLSLTESSREQLHRHLTRVAWWHWWHWWHVTASGAEPLLGLSYLPLACWEPPLSLIRPNTARSGHSLKSVQHHISGETTPLCRQIPQTSFRSYLNGWGIVRSGFRNHAKIEQL